MFRRIIRCKIVTLLVLLCPVYLSPKPVEAEGCLTIVALGDLALCKGAEEALERQGPDYSWRRVKEILAQGDLRIGNLETPLCDRRPIHYPCKLVHLRATPSMLASLQAGD